MGVFKTSARPWPTPNFVYFINNEETTICLPGGQAFKSSDDSHAFQWTRPQVFLAMVCIIYNNIPMDSHYARSVIIDLQIFL